MSPGLKAFQITEANFFEFEAHDSINTLLSYMLGCLGSVIPEALVCCVSGCVSVGGPWVTTLSTPTAVTFRVDPNKPLTEVEANAHMPRYRFEKARSMQKLPHW